MLSKVFNDTRPQSFFGLLIVGVLALVFLGYVTVPELDVGFAFFGNSFVVHPIVYFSLFGLLTLINAFLLNKKLADTFEVLKRNFYAAWFYLWLSMFAFLLSQDIELQVVNFVFILLWVHHFRLTNNTSANAVTFNFGLLLALLFWLVPPSIALLLAIFIGMIIYSVLSFRQFFLPLMGFGMLQLLLFTLLFWLDVAHIQGEWFTSATQLKRLAFGDYNSLQGSFAGVLIFYALLSFPDVVNTMQRANIYKRQTFGISIVFLLAIVLLTYLFGQSAYLLFGLSFPLLSMFFANALQYAKNKWLRLIIFGLLPTVFILLAMLAER
ncbi:MAG: DUF6427 family protein [Schleiferiaceae bacterium]|nr:DUF6427 family protein [Schleiferiaceae bacterium]